MSITLLYKKVNSFQKVFVDIYNIMLISALRVGLARQELQPKWDVGSGTDRTRDLDYDRRVRAHIICRQSLSGISVVLIRPRQMSSNLSAGTRAEDKFFKG